nr:MAG TPA: hypothetical protein [Caudoviricetes sp.]
MSAKTTPAASSTPEQQTPHTEPRSRPLCNS